MSEQFAFDEFFGNRCAIHFDERRVGAVAHEVNIAADEFLAGSAFTVDQNAAVGRRHDGDLFAQRLDRNAFTDDVKSLFQLMPEQVVGLFQSAMRQRVARSQQRVFQR